MEVSKEAEIGQLHCSTPFLNKKPSIRVKHQTACNVIILSLLWTSVTHEAAKENFYKIVTISARL